MHKGMLFVSIVLISGFSMSIANAADTISWYNGFYAGGQMGYTFGEADHTFSNGAPSGDSKPKGLDPGIFVGYQKNINDLLIGLEVDFNKPNVDGDYIDTTGGTSGGSVDFNYTYSIRARLGYLVSSLNILPYLTGGFTHSDVDIQGGPSYAPQAGQYSASYNGWTAGLGVEKSLSNHFTARLEYRYSDFGSEDGNLSPAIATVQMPVDLKTQSVLIGFYYQF